MPDLSLIAHVRRGGLNFEHLVEVLSNPERGYILEGCDEFHFISTTIERANQDDFNALWEVLFPGRLNNIQLMGTATDEGCAQRGSYTYVLYNANVIEYQEVKQVLIRANRAGAQDI